jgi:AraC-like DNA-binding protein
LNAGAEMYLEKPFTMDYLNASIQRALSNLVKLQSSHNEAWTETTDPVILPNRDADFMKRLNEIIQENLGNASYSIAEMENDLFMSRSALNRKMKALFNTTPSEHLRRCRIEKAAELLQTEGVRVNEVAYMVGFTSASYFARCFRQQFGCLPTEYAKKHQSRERR